MFIGLYIAASSSWGSAGKRLAGRQSMILGLWERGAHSEGFFARSQPWLLMLDIEATWKESRASYCLDHALLPFKAVLNVATQQCGARLWAKHSQ